MWQSVIAMNKVKPSKDSRIPEANKTNVPDKKQHTLNLCTECIKLYSVWALGKLLGRNSDRQEISPAHSFQPIVCILIIASPIECHSIYDHVWEMSERKNENPPKNPFIYNHVHKQKTHLLQYTNTRKSSFQHQVPCTLSVFILKFIR